MLCEVTEGKVAGATIPWSTSYLIDPGNVIWSTTMERTKYASVHKIPHLLYKIKEMVVTLQCPGLFLETSKIV